MENKKNFEFIENTEDVKVRVFGSTLKSLFDNAANALFQIVLPKASGCYIKDEQEECSKFTSNRKISVASGNRESLLVDFLSEILSLMDDHNEAYGKVTIHVLSDTELKATLHGVPVVAFQGEYVKEVAYNQVHIERKSDDHWEAVVVFDV